MTWLLGPVLRCVLCQVIARILYISVRLSINFAARIQFIDAFFSRNSFIAADDLLLVVAFLLLAPPHGRLR